MTEDALAPAAVPVPEFDPDAVATWLADHPDFFAGREALLAEMVLPHAAGEAVSLVERQLGVLRDRNAELHRRLRDLTETTRTNHRIFERTLEITASLHDAAAPEDLVRRLAEGLESGFDVDATIVRVIDLEGVGAAFAGETTDGASAREAVGNLLRPGRIVCGLLRDVELAFLFGGRAAGIASAAVMPVEIPGGIVLVALGSADADHFSPEMGTLFLRFLGDTLSQRLGQLVVSAPE
jgi:uncharacterized protein YigA (DUF484 family)